MGSRSAVISTTCLCFFFFQAEDGIRDHCVTGVQTCALPISASVMTCIDGYAMTQRGRAGAALAISAVGSFVAGTLGVVGLMLLAPTLAAFALRFGPPEYTALLVMGFFILAYMSGGSMLKTLAMAAFGLVLGMIGIDAMSGYTRFSFGVLALSDGVGIVPVAVGLFGISEILMVAGSGGRGAIIRPRLRELMP